MTTSIVWPATLPCFRFEPYNVAPRPGAVEMTVGMVTERAMVYTENNEVISVEMILSSAQEVTLRTFFKTTTVMGTQSFLVELLMAGTMEDREATFYGAPPTFTPVAPGYVRTAFTLLAKATLPVAVTYELVATDYVNITADDFGGSASLPPSPIGTTVTISVQPGDQIRITKPSVASDGNMDWDAWSAYATDGSNPPGDGLTWFNNFLVSNQDGDQVLHFQTARQVSPTPALLAAQAAMPVTLSGHTAYTFWYFDTPVGDNRRGLSLKVETYRPVITP